MLRCEEGVLNQVQSDLDVDACGEFLDALPLGLYVVDRDLHVVAWNATRESGPLGISRRRAIGRPLSEVLPPEGFAKARVAIEKVFATGTEIQETALPRGPRASVYHCRRRPVIRDGRITHVLSVFEDVTELSRANRLQQALYRITEATQLAEDMEAFYATIQAVVRELIVAVNVKVALREEGSDTISFPHFIDEGDAPPGPCTPEGTLTAYVLTRGRPLLCTPSAYAELVENGEIEPVGHPAIEWLGVPLQARGRTFGALVVQSEDETCPLGEADLELLTFVGQHVAAAIDRKMALSERQGLQEQLLHSQKMDALGRLAGGIAHDFNNLLGVVVGYCELLLHDQPQGTPARRRLEEIAHCAERATWLTRQLLAFSRKQVLDPKVLDLDSVLSRMHDMLRRLIGEDIHLVTAPSAGIGRIKADAGQIEQVVMNLAVNARDAMPKGGRLTIETRNLDLTAENAVEHAGVPAGRYVMLAVADTGTGMSKETRRRIFEPFFTTKPAGKGTGLGLATVHGIVAQSGGHLGVSSEPGLGTTFRIYLPRVDAPVKEEAPSGDAGALPARSETILLVEDDPALREVARCILEELGHTVLEASSGEPALELARRHAGPVHLLLTDVVMPGIGGLDLARRLIHGRPETRVVFMSGHSPGMPSNQEILDHGHAFLSKPFTGRALATTIDHVLAGSAPA